MPLGWDIQMKNTLEVSAAPAIRAIPFKSTPSCLLKDVYPFNEVLAKGQLVLDDLQGSAKRGAEGWILDIHNLWNLWWWSFLLNSCRKSQQLSICFLVGVHHSVRSCLPKNQPAEGDEWRGPLIFSRWCGGFADSILAKWGDGSRSILFGFPSSTKKMALTRVNLTCFDGWHLVVMFDLTCFDG